MGCGMAFRRQREMPSPDFVPGRSFRCSTEDGLHARYVTGATTRDAAHRPRRPGGTSRPGLPLQQEPRHTGIIDESTRWPSHRNLAGRGFARPGRELPTLVAGATLRGVEQSSPHLIHSESTNPRSAPAKDPPALDASGKAHGVQGLVRKTAWRAVAVGGIGTDFFCVGEVVARLTTSREHPSSLRWTYRAQDRPTTL